MQTGCMVCRVFMSGSLNAAPCIVVCVAGCCAAAIGVLNDSQIPARVTLHLINFTRNLLISLQFAN
jgi:hypothetical protein